MTAHAAIRSSFKDAGFAPGSDERIAAQARFGERCRRGDVARGSRPAISNPGREQVVSDEFVAEVLRKVQLHIAAGFWDQAKDTLDASKREWLIQEQQRKCYSGSPEVLGWHVSNLFDARTAGIIEQVCCGTVGSLLECFPVAFIDLPMCGPSTIEKIAKGLTRIGAITADEAQKRIEQYAESVQSRYLSSESRATLRNLLMARRGKGER